MNIFPFLLDFYKCYSQLTLQQIQGGPKYVIQSAVVRTMRAVKKDILTLLTTYFEKCDNPTLVDNIYPPILEAMIVDYQASPNEAKDVEVLTTCTALVTLLKGAASKECFRLFEQIYVPTVWMCQPNFEDFPEHREKIFGLVQQLVNNCFPSK